VFVPGDDVVLEARLSYWATRTMRVTREWSRMVSQDTNSSQGVAGCGTIGPRWLAPWAGVERSLSQAYSVTENRREEFAEEIGVEVEPGAAVTVVLGWKRSWRHGVVHVLFEGSQVA
jgi:hypothetical protein